MAVTVFLAPGPFGAGGQFSDGNGNPLALGQITTYLAGTTTPAATYTGPGLTQAANANPIILGPDGRPPQEIWIPQGVAMKFIVADALGSQAGPTYDNLSGVNDTTFAVSEWIPLNLTPTQLSATSFSVPGNVTGTLNAGRRIQTINSGGTVYSTIIGSGFAAGVTTVTMLNDSGVLDSGLSAVSYAFLSGTNPSVPPFRSTSSEILIDNADPTKAIKFSAGGLPTATIRTIDVSLIANAPLFNGTLVASVAGNALTIALKTIAGNDPSGADPVFASFRNATVGIGDNTVMQLTAPSSIVVPSGATLGAVNSVPFKLWIVGFNDAGTFRLGVINTVLGGNIYPLGQFPIASSTAISAASGSAQVFYTGAAVASKAYVPLGYVSYEAGLVTAGTYNGAPTRIQLFSHNVPLPGTPVQIASNATGAVGSGATTIPFNDTIPQITGGNEYMTQAIAPSSTANLLRVTASAFLASSAATQDMTMALFQDATANALAAVHDVTYAANGGNQMALRHSMLAGTTASTIFRIRAGGSVAGTTTFNGLAAARLLGGVFASYLQVEEIMT